MSYNRYRLKQDPHKGRRGEVGPGVQWPGYFSGPLKFDMGGVWELVHILYYP